MITIHHLGVSQSDRIVWLMEELGLPYRLQWYDRREDMLAPAELRDVHPMGTAPAITDGDLVLADSAAICEYVSQRHGGGALSVGVDEADYPHYLYWLQFNNNAQTSAMIRIGIESSGGADESNVVYRTASLRQEGLYRQLDEGLGQHDYLAADRFTCADIMAMFNLTTLPGFGGRDIGDLPNAQAYVARLSARPAYQKAMAIAGPDATRA